MSYLLSFMPLMGTSVPVVTQSGTEPPRIEFIAVVDTRDSDREDGGDSMVLGFAGDSLAYDSKKQVLMVSLIRGVSALSNEFSHSSDNGASTVINGGTTNTTVCFVDENFQIICSIRQDSEIGSSKPSLVVQQVTRMVEGAYRFFKMHNTSMECFVKEYSRSVVSRQLCQFWSGFITNYNLRIPGVGLGYRGFLGLLPSCDSYRKSGLPYELEGNRTINIFTEHAPNTLCGMVIANFDKDLAKQYGVVGFVEGLKSNNSVSTKSLADVYGWLEYLDCTGKLDTPGLTNVNNEQIFEDGGHKDALTSSPPPLPAESAPYRYQDYITQPINSTILTVVDGFGEMVRSSESVWSSIPGMSGMLHKSTTAPKDSARSGIVTAGGGVTNPEDDSGHYILGATGPETKLVIYRRMVYLDDQSGNGRQYHLIVYCYEAVHIILIFDEKETSLGSTEIYTNLKSIGLDEISRQVQRSGAVSVNGTALSTQSLGNYIPNNTEDGNFFYIVHDTVDNSFASSLPYLRWTQENTPKVALLHEQLSTLFALPQYSWFYENAHMDEYFHKFTSSVSTNWLFYFIKHRTQQIIIIEKQRSKKEEVPVENRTLEGALISILTAAASHGFFENLGGDVRLWLDSILTKNTSVTARESGD